MDSARRRQSDATEDVLGQAPLSVLLLQRLVPALWAELENPTPGPVRQQAEEVSQVGPGLQLVQPAGGNQRDEDGVPLGALIAADDSS